MNPELCFVDAEKAGILGAGAGVCACSVFSVVLAICDAAGVAGSELLNCLCNNVVLGISVGAGGACGAGGAGCAVVVIVAGVAAAGLMPSEIRSLDTLVLVLGGGNSSMACACVASCQWPGGWVWPGGDIWPGGVLWPGGVVMWPGGVVVWPGGS